MNMKTDLKLLIPALLLALTLTSCGSEPHYIGQDKKNVASYKVGAGGGEFEYTAAEDSMYQYNCTSDTSLLFSDGYLYFYNGWTIMRYNPETGNITSVCADPMCSHKDYSCPLYDMFNGSEIYVYNNIVYQRRAYIKQLYDASGNYTGSDKWAGFTAYDIESGNEYVIETYDDTGYSGQNNRIYADGYRFYYQNYTDEETGESLCRICRMTLSDGTSVTLEGFDRLINGEVFFTFCMDEHIYFTDLKTLFYTDYDGKNRVDIALGSFCDVVTNGEYIFYIVRDDSTDIFGNMTNNGVIYRMNKDGSGVVALPQTSGRFYVTGSYIYYCTPTDYKNIGTYSNDVYGAPSSEVMINTSSLRRCKTDGTEDKLILEFDGEYEYYGLHQNPIIIDDDYVYLTYFFYTDEDGDKVFNSVDFYESSYADNYNLMRVNVETGEIYYIRGAL